MGQWDKPWAWLWDYGYKRQSHRPCRLDPALDLFFFGLSLVTHLMGHPKTESLLTIG